LGNDPIEGKKFASTVLGEFCKDESKKIDSSAFSVRILLFFLREKRDRSQGRNSHPEKKKHLIEVKIGQKRPFSASFRLFSRHADGRMQ
jgi:hypothetical protein